MERECREVLNTVQIAAQKTLIHNYYKANLRLFSMNILFVSEYYQPKIMGGGEVNLHLVAKALVQRGQSVTVLTSHHAGLERKEVLDGVTVYRTLQTGENPQELAENVKRAWKFPSSVVKEVRKITAQHNFDVVHLTGTSLIAAPHIKNVPLVATIESYPSLCPKGDRIYHGKKECTIQCSPTAFIGCQAACKEIGKMQNRWYTKYNPPLLYYVYRHYAKMQEALGHCHLIAISNYIQNVLKQHGHESTVIPNAIDIDFFTRKGKKKGKRVLYLGSLIRSKGPQVLCKAVQGLDVEAHLYGTGILQLHGKNVTVHEPVPYEQIPQLIADHDVVVFPSIWPEPFGRISIEAMAAGTPVIGSAIGGIKETLEKGGGILVPPGDVSALRDAITRVLDDPKLQQRCTKEGKNIVESYREENIIEKLIDTYHALQ